MRRIIGGIWALLACGCSLAVPVTIEVPDAKVPRIRELCAVYAEIHEIVGTFGDRDCARAILFEGLRELDRIDRVATANENARAARRAAAATAEAEFDQTYSVRACGDGRIDPPEDCDDGNADAGDGCSADCDVVESGWSCIGEPSVCSPAAP